MDRKVVITGVGVLSPLGDSASDLHGALCAGRSALSPVEKFDPAPMQNRTAGEIAGFKPADYLGKKNFRPLDRASQFAASAVQMALEDCGDSEALREENEVGLVVGTMFCSVHTIAEFDRRGVTSGPARVKPLDFANTVINAAAGQTAIWHNLRGVNSTLATGGSSSLNALAYAADMIRTGRSQAIVAGGVEELCFESMYGYYRAGLLAGCTDDSSPHPVPFDEERNGFALGEGATFLVLEEAEFADSRGANVIGAIVGYGKAYDYSRGKEDGPGVEALAQAIAVGLREGRISATDIDCISASANGSVRGDRNEATALSTVFGTKISDIPVSAIKSMLGDTLGVAGATQAAVLLTGMRQGNLPGIPGLRNIDTDVSLTIADPHTQLDNLSHGLITAVSTDGNACALVLKKT